MVSAIAARTRTWVCAALLPAGVLVVDPRGYAPFGPLRWAVVSVLALLVVASVATGEVRVSRRPAIAWVAFLAWVCVCAARGADPLYAWIGTAERHFGALTWCLCGLMFVAGHALDDEPSARVVTGAAIAGTGVAGAWAVAEELGWQPLRLAGSTRLVGSLGSASYLGAAMALAVPMALGVALDRSWSRHARLGAAIATGFTLAALVGSGARAAWVGLAAAAVLVVWSRREAVRRNVTTVAPVALIALGAIVLVGAASGVGDRLLSTFDHNAGGGASRFEEWGLAVDVIRDHPVVGVGPEGYRVTFPEVRTAAYELRYGSATTTDRAHDGLLDVAATTGLPGVALYLAVLALCALALWRALRGRQPWLCGVACGVTAYAVQELFLFPVAELEPAVWLLVGMLAVQVAKPSELATLRVRAAALVALGFAAVALVAGVRDVAADHDARAVLADLARGDVLAARVAGNRAVGLRGDQIDYRLAAARADAALDDVSSIGDALHQVAAALRTSPRDPVVRQEKATLLVQVAQLSPTPANVGTAVAYLSGLTQGDRFNPGIQLQLGVVLALQGDASRAEATWREAAWLAPAAPGPPTDLATLYASQHEWASASREARAALARDPSDAQAARVLAEAGAGADGTE